MHTSTHSPVGLIMRPGLTARVAATAALVAVASLAAATVNAGSFNVAAPQAIGDGIVQAAAPSRLSCRLAEPPVVFKVQKRWFASSDTADYSFYSPPGSEFVMSQSPWGHSDMAEGDLYMAEASTGSNGYLRMRTVSGPLRSGRNMPKGAPNLTFGDHFHLRPAIRPFGDGVWSDTINELKVSVGGTASSLSTGAYARAIQIHGFRTAYTGNAWSDFSQTRGDTHNIQIRYKTNGTFPLYGSGTDQLIERKTIGNHTWDIYRTSGGGWPSDVSIGFVLTENVENIEDVDVKAIIDYALADSNARLERNDQAIYVRGVQTWVETISGTVDATMEGMTVRYNGESYGVPKGN